MRWRADQGWDAGKPCSSHWEPVREGAARWVSVQTASRLELRSCRRNENLPPCCVILTHDSASLSLSSHLHDWDRVSSSVSLAWRTVGDQ